MKLKYMSKSLRIGTVLKRGLRAICWIRVFCLVTLLVSDSSSLVAQANETAQAHIHRLIKEAAGVQPAPNNGFRSDTGFDRAFRSQYRDLIKANQIYAAALKQIDSAKVRQLGSPESLTHPASASSALDQLHSGYALEVEHERRVQQIYARLRHVFETADVSASVRISLLKIFEDTIGVPSSERQRCIAAEKAWIDSMDDLYRYANLHIETLELVDGTVAISDPIIQHEFNGKIVSEEIHRRAFIEKKHEYAQLQARVFRALAIDPTNVGLQ
jgi:hypothetical protein